MAISIGHYLDNMSKLTNQWDQSNYRERDRQRIYLKDIDCPQVWHDKLKQQIPLNVFYLNESTGKIGGPGSVDESNSPGPGTRKGRGIARAGDLMSCLPPHMRADNLMCYIGHEGTYTPAHREMCASLGQNIMVENSGTFDEHGKPTKPGSSIWFMTETKDRHLVSEYWLSTLGHDIEVEAHFAQINAWKAAPFKTYVVEQKVGDFILIPPLAPHQVWNRGTRTMKVAWNRTTVETLELALNEALPRARMVCRDEQYKNKAIVLFSLEKYSKLFKHIEQQKQTTADPQAHLDLTYSPKIRQLQKDFKRLFSLYTQILLSETLSPVTPAEKKGQYIPYDSYITCSYCRCNIFNRFLTCTSCIIPLQNGDEDTYDICMECYAMGRSCKCISKYKWVEQFPWQDLTQKHELWRNQIIAFDGKVSNKSPLPLQVERKNMTKKTLAQVCQEQLKVRPWFDPKKEDSVPDENPELEETQVNADGTTIRRRRKLSEKVLKETAVCHIAQQRVPRWKAAICDCGRGYAYGSLFRAFDLMPLSVMEDPEWRCPNCLKICSCAACRRDPTMNPFEPKGTILGHDTKKVADPRSVESLVDFSHSNMVWIKKAGDDHPGDTRRLRRRKDEAAQDKSTNPELDDHYVDDGESTPITSQPPDNQILYNMDIDVPIDPLLRTEQFSAVSHQRSNEHHTIQSSHESQHVNKRPKLTVEATESQRNVETENPDQEVLNSHNNHFRGFVAPAAIMVEENSQPGVYTAQDANGIIYEYPDPTLPHFAPSPRTEQHSRPVESAPNGSYLGENQQKRADAQISSQTDLAVSTKNDANQQYHQAQIQRTLAEAKRNNRLISAEAAMFGKSLRLVFSVDRTKLANISSKSAASQEVTSTLARDDDHEKENDKTEKIIVYSDAPVLPPAQIQPSRPVRPPKKKKAKADDDDEDFSTVKKPSRKPVAARLSLPDPMRKPSVYREHSSGSDGDDPLETAQTLVENSHKPRTLPAYLARRSDGVIIEPSEDPYEALSLHRKRKKVSPEPVSQNYQAQPTPPVVHNASDLRDSSSTVAFSKPSSHLDPLIGGSIETIPSIDAATKQAEENRKAKLRAMHWNDGEEDESDPSISFHGSNSDQ